MLVENINLKSYNRFFSFGCSFTKYKWTTWADLIGQHFSIYENWGEHAAGNQFIFNSIVECHKRNNFSKGDLIGIMWTSALREDRYTDKWTFAVTDQRKKIYGKKWMNDFGKFETGNLIRDLAAIEATQHMLSNLGVDWVNLNSIPLIRFDYDKVYNDIRNDKITIEEIEKRWTICQRQLSQGIEINELYLMAPDVINMYKDLFQNIKYPLLETIINTDRIDKHPTPLEAFLYLNDTLKIDVNYDIDAINCRTTPTRF
jgi:hypothetical protein